MKLFVVFSCLLLQITASLYAIMSDYTHIRPRADNSHAIVVDDNVIACIAAMVHDAAQNNRCEKLPEPIKRCYMHLDKGLLGLPVEDVIAALPNILHYAVEQHKKRSLCGSGQITRFSNSDSSNYDFFITQSPTQTDNNHPITKPITQPGIYCLAENVFGTIIIHSSHVTIMFKNYTLTTTNLGGIISSDNNYIRIEGGIIMGNNKNSVPAIALNNGNNIEIYNMNFDNNNLSITFNNVQNFLIHNSQFSNYTGSNINLTHSNGKISACLSFNNKSLSKIPDWYSRCTVCEH